MGKKVTPEMVEAILKDTRSQTQIARDYNIGRTTVQRIKEGLITGKNSGSNPNPRRR